MTAPDPETPTPTDEAGRVREAARDVLAERERQKAVEGWTPEHDDKHKAGDIACAAATYALLACASLYPIERARDDIRAGAREWWPWRRVWLKSTDPRRDLVKAGALILAEIERLDRAALAAPEPAGPAADGEDGA